MAGVEHRLGIVCRTAHAGYAPAQLEILGFLTTAPEGCLLRDIAQAVRRPGPRVLYWMDRLIIDGVVQRATDVSGAVRFTSQ
jgi:hypothetical protein